MTLAGNKKQLYFQYPLTEI